MTPAELARRIAAMDWSACSLQHQLAVTCAVSTLEGLERRESNVLPFPRSNPYQHGCDPSLQLEEDGAHEPVIDIEN
jgi:hypothetical protein